MSDDYDNASYFAYLNMSQDLVDFARNMERVLSVYFSVERNSVTCFFAHSENLSYLCTLERK